jgi:hypothetical protein
MFISMKKVFSLVAACLFVASGLIQAVPFTEGNLVVYRMGTTAEADLYGTNSNGAPIFLDEYTFDDLGGLEFVQSVEIPVEQNGDNYGVVGEIHKGLVYQGHLSRSDCGRYIVFGGYKPLLNMDPPMAFKYKSGSNLYSTNNPRILVRVDASGNVNSATALTDAYSRVANGASDIRSVASYDGTQFWTTGNWRGGGGTRYTTLGATTSIQVNDASGRAIQIYKGQLYETWDNRFIAVGDGLPISSCSRDTLFTSAAPDGATLDGAGFCFAELPEGRVLYLVSCNSKHIKKYSVLADGSYKYDGEVSLGSLSSVGATVDVICKVSGNDVHLYVSAVTNWFDAANGSGGGIYYVVDNGGYDAAFSGSVPLQMMTPPARTSIRGLAWAPVHENLLTSAKTPTTENVSIYVSDKTIYVKSAQATAIAVYNLLGVKVAAGQVAAGATEQIAGLPQGRIYIVKVGNVVKKVML